MPFKMAATFPSVHRDTAFVTSRDRLDDYYSTKLIYRLYYCLLVERMSFYRINEWNVQFVSAIVLFAKLCKDGNESMYISLSVYKLLNITIDWDREYFRGILFGGLTIQGSQYNNTAIWDIYICICQLCGTLRIGGVYNSLFNCYLLLRYSRKLCIWYWQGSCH